MENRNVHEIYERVCRNIISSRSLLQLQTSERLVELFRRQHVHPELSEKLDAVFIRKADTLHYFEWKRSRDVGAAA